MKKSRLPFILTLLILVFFYVPLVVLAVHSFNDSKYGGAWNGFTLKWYSFLFTDKNIWNALMNSLIVAMSATLVSTTLGTFAAFALNRFKTKLQMFHNLLIYAPLIVPDILMGISLLLLLVAIHVKLGLFTIFLAHVTFCVSYVAMVVLGRLQDFDFGMIEAARDLGASWLKAVWYVVLPLLAPGIIAGGLMAFTLSIDDFVITFFVTGPGSATLPLYIYSMIKHGSTTVINALSVIMILFTFVTIIISKKLLEIKS